MDWKTASEFTMPFGKYSRQRLDEIAETDEGLLYLDWLRGWLAGKENLAGLLEVVEIYLSDSAIAKELDALLAKKQD